MRASGHRRFFDLIAGYVFKRTQVAANTIELMQPLEDETAFVAGNDFRVPKGMNMIGMALGIGGDLLLNELDSPQLRGISRHWITPPENSDQVNSYGPTPTFLANPPKVREGESLNAYVEASSVGATTQLGVWLMNSVPSPIVGQDLRTIRGTVDHDYPAGQWGSAQITLDQDLPDGWYEVIGAKVAGAGQFARLIFPDKQNQRPMFPITTNSVTPWDQVFRYGKLGPMGRFQNFVAPKLEVYGEAATADQTVYLDIVKMT